MHSMMLNALTGIIATAFLGTAMAQEQIAEATPVAPIAEATPLGSAIESSNKEVELDATGTEAKPAAMRPLTVAADLLSDTKITGTLIDSTTLQMKTAFGEAQIPLTEIAGIRFPGGEDNSTTVVMLNGDSITGATDLRALTVETEWGTAKINGQSLVSLLFVPGLQWEGINGLNGKRWALTELKPKPGTNLGVPNSNPPGLPLPGNNVSGTSGAINGVIIQGSPGLPGNRVLPPTSGAPLNFPR